MRYGLVRLTPAVKTIILITSGMFLLELAVSFTTGKPWLVAWLSLILRPQDYSPLVWLEIWRPFTYTLLHADFSHLFWNMIGLFFLGAALEDEIGTGRFYRVYLVSGLAGALTSILAASFGIGSDMLVGASAAVMGTTFAFIAIYPNQTIMMWFLVLIPVKALYLGVILLLIQVFNLLGAPNSGVSYAAHLGGIAAGVIMARQGLYFDRLSFRSLGKGLDYWHKRWRLRHLKPLSGKASASISRATSSRISQLDFGGTMATTVPSHNPKIIAIHTKTNSAAAQQLEELLDKMRREGVKSLTPEENQLLESLRHQKPSDHCNDPSALT